MLGRPVLAALVVALTVAFVGARPSAPSPTADFDAAAVPDEVLVRLTPAGFGLTDEVLELRLGATVNGRIDGLNVVRLGLDDRDTPADAIGRLAGQPFVEHAEPNHIVRAAYAPNDAFYSAQSSYLELIGAPDAWNITAGDTSVIVAVLDSGIDLTHVDLQGKIWTNPLENASNDSDDDHNGCSDDLFGCNFVSPGSADPTCGKRDQSNIEDDNGHGTFVAGIIGAQGNNAVGVTGAAPNVTILPVKILDCLGGGTAADAAQALLYAARVGARVANISFGADGESQTLANAIREAHDRYGMVIVAATGNEGTDRVTFPARLPQTMAIGASGTAFDTSARSPFSDWGPEVSVAAPGLNIVSTVPPQFCESTWLCVEGEPYAVASGTSFAAPIVSALAALLISHNPNLSPDAVRRIIETTATPLTDGTTPNWDGRGRIRMGIALSVPRFFIGIAGVATE